MIITYQNYKGGINNLTVVHENLKGGVFATSTKGEKQAIKNFKRNYQKTYNKKYSEVKNG